MGQENRVLRVITAYRPIKTDTAKVYSVYRQHWAHFTKEKWQVDPRAAILLDPAKQIKEWAKDGDQVILMMDVNEDVRKPTIQSFLSELGMREVLHEKHGASGAPRTHLKGSIPIDGIFAMKSLDIIAGGYAAFDQGVKSKRTDHRCLWIDVKLVDVFGHSMPGPVKFAARRVHGKDPHTFTRFNDRYKAFSLQSGLARRIFTLEKQATYTIPPHLRIEAEEISKLRYAGIRHADKKSRKLRFGGAAYTPKFR